MAADLDTLLTDVEAAITALVATGDGVQTYTINTPGGGSRTVGRTDLTQLRAWRAEIKKEIQYRDAAASTSGTRNAARRGLP